MSLLKFQTCWSKQSVGFKMLMNMKHWWAGVIVKSG